MEARRTRKIILLLAKRPMAFYELATHFPVSRPMISMHLRVLHQARLVEGTTVGRERVYSIRPGDDSRHAVEVASLDSQYDRAFRRLRSHLEESEGV